MTVLGLKIVSHDTGAALIHDGKIVAISEERLNRIKHSFNLFPHLSIDYCLNALNIAPEAVDLIVIDQVGLRSKVRMRELFLKEVGEKFGHAEIHVINHHDAHAASAFFCSPFDDAAVLVYDGAGEKFETHHGVFAVETETLYRGVGNTLHQIQKTTHVREGKVFPFTFGIGKLYNFLSATYLGFGSYNEGKMMGLAPYGDDTLLKQFPPERWFVEKEGHIVCNSNIRYPRLRSVVEGITLVNFLPRLVRKVSHIALYPYRVLQARVRRENAVKIFDPIVLPKPARTKDVELPDPYYSSVAFAGQKVLEQVAIRWGMKLKAITGAANLCIAGGVGLNIDANKSFIDTVGFSNIFIQPGASDAGVPLGCALYGYHVIAGKARFYHMQSASLGRTYTDTEIQAALEEVEDRVTVRKSGSVAKDTAKLLADKKIVGWFYGGSEYGPRALGHRSIICDPRGPEMSKILNSRVKHRELWRPFATSILSNQVETYFDLAFDSPFMLLAAKAKPGVKEQVPAVIHVDNTSRIQSVTKEANGRYFDLIEAFYEETGVPLILNTSFNLGGDPIVETPQDALATFLKTDFDYLVLEDYIIGKRQEK